MENKTARVMPHNIDAEEALLGAILIDSEITVDVMPVLKESDFYSESNKLVFESMKSIYLRSCPIDFVTLTDELERNGNVQKVGGIEQLTKLSTSIPSAANFKHYLEIVKRDSLKRAIIRASQTTIETSFTNDDDLDILAFAQTQLSDISEKNGSKFPSKIGESCDEVVGRFRTVAKDKSAFKGLTTGLKGLDEKLNGMQKSDLILVAARPSEGKTSLAMNMVENASILGGATSLVFSLEMSKVQLAQRMLCSNAKVKMEKAVKGLLSFQDWEQLYKAQTNLTSAKILIDDTASITPADMLNKCRRVQAKYGLDLIMVDYIQLMSAGGKNKDNRQQEITEISRNLKLIAREMNCPLIALSQLSRGIESRNPPLPQLSDLRDSGAIEQDADIVLFIYNPEGKRATGATGENFTGNGNSGIKEIIIAKHRNGPLGTVPMRWNAEIVRFEDPVGYIKPQMTAENEGGVKAPSYSQMDEIYGENLSFEEPNDRFNGSQNIQNYDEEIYGGDTLEGLVPPPEEE